MSLADWGVLVGILAVLNGVFLLALDERMRKKFASRDDLAHTREDLEHDLNEMGKKVDRNTNLFVGIDDRVGAVETNQKVLEERQTQEWKYISAQMAQTADTIREVTRELKEVTRMQYELRAERQRQGD